MQILQVLWNIFDKVLLHFAICNCKYDIEALGHQGWTIQIPPRFWKKNGIFPRLWNWLPAISPLPLENPKKLTPLIFHNFWFDLNISLLVSHPFWELTSPLGTLDNEFDFPVFFEPHNFCPKNSVRNFLPHLERPLIFWKWLSEIFPHT